jgi:hypothetical protein
MRFCEFIELQSLPKAYIRTIKFWLDYFMTTLKILDYGDIFSIRGNSYHYAMQSLPQVRILFDMNCC